MDEKPYKFESGNPRIASNVQRPSNVPILAGALFVGSLYLYNRKIFRIN